MDRSSLIETATAITGRILDRPHRIDRVRFDEHQLLIGADELELTAYVAISGCSASMTAWRVAADFRERGQETAYLSALVSEDLSHCEYLDHRGLQFKLGSGASFVLELDQEFENFAIVGLSETPLIF